MKQSLKILSVFLLVLILTLFLVIGSYWVDHKFRNNIWPHISQIVGPMESDVERILSSNLPVYTRVDVPIVFTDCETNRNAQFLLQSKLIRLRPDCSVELVEVEAWLSDHPDINASEYKAGNFYLSQSARSLKSIEVVSTNWDGKAYRIEFVANVESSPYAVLLGSDEDLVVAYKGYFLTSFHSRGILNPRWEILGPISSQVIRRRHNEVKP